MKPRFRRYARLALAALTLLMLAGWIVPSFFSAERYRRRLEAGLERALQRRVSFGAVTFRLVPHPGFSIENAVVHEDPIFGSEPLARVDRINCNLRWRSFFHSGFDFSRLDLDHPSFNLVRNPQGQWNIESLLRQTGLTSPESQTRGGAPRGTGSPDNLDLEMDDARIDFKVGPDKKPFTLTDVSARINFNRQLGQVSFRASASPIRTDLSLPTPGIVELNGEWTPARDLEGPLDAALQTRGALLYDWVALIAGRNPEIYGMLDADIHLTGSLHSLRFDGQSRLSQLHRGEQHPPAEPMPSTVFFRGQYDRTRGRVLLESVDGAFADSHIHLTGSIDKVPSSPELDLVVAVERSRLEDFLALSSRLFGRSFTFGVSGRVNALLAVQGPWKDRRYAGFVGAREVQLSTASGAFPVSEVNVRIENKQARLTPVTVALAPRVELVVEGAIESAVPAGPPPRAKKAAGRIEPGPPRYEISITARAAPLHDLISFGRATGLFSAQGLDARGSASATFTLSGSAWPLERPVVEGRAELHAAGLLVPGLTEPLNLPRARILVNGDEVIAEPVVAVLGTSVFTGRLEHRGERTEPWKFDIRANTLSLEQGSLWFDALGRRQPIPLLERLPGLGSFGAVRLAASNIFGALKARGRFYSPVVNYRAVNLTDFKTSAEISGRVIRLDGASFRAGGGRGQARVVVDLTTTPARVALDVSMTDGSLQPLSPHLPAAVQKVRGTYSGTAHFETRGLSHEEMTDNLQGSATLRLKSVFLGGFDPLQILARDAGWGTLEPARGELGLPTSVVNLQVNDRHVRLGNSSLEISGAKLRVTGGYDFTGALELNVHADLSRLTRRWLKVEDESSPHARAVDVHLAGPVERLAVVPKMAASQASPSHRGR